MKGLPSEEQAHWHTRHQVAIRDPGRPGQHTDGATLAVRDNRQLVLRFGVVERQDFATGSIILDLIALLITGAVSARLCRNFTASVSLLDFN